MPEITVMAPPSVPALCPGQTVVCVATGPSLTAADVDYARARAPIVAVNDAHLVAPDAAVLYSSDPYWYQHYKGVPAFKGLKFGIAARGGGHAFAAGYPSIGVLKNTGIEGLENSPEGLRTGQNSGYAAINLAVHLGASRIVLLGYDMGVTRGGQTHFFGHHPSPLANQSPYATFLKAFHTIVEPLKARGVEVVNCTRQTQLAVFPKADLRAVLV